MDNREMSEYLSVKKAQSLPRLPLEGNIDLTYRCNNQCRHCWLWLPENAAEKEQELSFDEIRRIADEARALGCRRWNLSGGEPMLRADFSEIFDYLTRKSAPYSLNTNGTLITPAIARLLKREGNKIVALYGANAEVYHSVTGNPGGFAQAMQGFEYLKEAGAGFTVQLIPMRANYHQWKEMLGLAIRLSPHYRVGAPWLYLSACGSPGRNAEIVRQRLAPKDVVALDPPNPSYEERMEELDSGREPGAGACCAVASGDDRLFAGCIAGRRDFHIDACGTMSWCSFVVDRTLRYDLRGGTFREAWEEFIPSVSDRVRGGKEWRTGCGSCSKRADCYWCAAHSYLESGRYSAPVPYLCALAEETERFKAGWRDKHRRYFRIAGITVRVESDLDLGAVKFDEKFASFAVDGPGDDNVTLRHYFEMPDLKGKNLGVELYRKAPWAISRQDGSWFYRGISPDESDPGLHRMAVFASDYRHGTIYSPESDADYVRTEAWPSLSLFPTDQIWLAPLLADRNAVLLHSAAVILNGQGLLFAGHSEAGKSTTVTMLRNAAREANGRPPVRAEILCDDRNIVRRSGIWRVHGTWSHGDVADVSSASAPLRAILFLQQDTDNKIVPLVDRKHIWKRLLVTLIKPMVTVEWWQKEMNVLEQIVNEVPCYTMHFDRSGAITEKLVHLCE
jgi:MoaA/NifB/PqqE/SkfB family radical SAM enzyme